MLNPDSVLAQTEGNVIFGLSQTLKEQVSISGGQVQQNNFYDYPVLRMSEMPEIDIQLMPTDNPAKGIGEASLPLIAPCVGNALFKLTGKALPRDADVAGAGESGDGGLTTRRLPWPCALAVAAHCGAASCLMRAIATDRVRESATT